MNKLKLTFLLAFLCQFCFGQVKSNRNELSISGLNYSSIPFFYVNNQKPFRVNYGLNVMYKRNLNNEIYLRINQTYSKYTVQHIHEQDFEGFQGEDNGREIYSSIGFEHRYFQGKKFTIYSGFDFTGIFCKNINRQALSTNFTRETVTGIALQPFTGVSYTLPANLVLTLESSLMLGVANSKNFGGNSKEGNSNIMAYGQLFPVRLISLGYKF